MVRNPAFVCSVAFSLLLAVGGCGGGGDAPVVAEQTTPEPPPPATPPPPPPPPPPPCIPIHGGGCVTEQVFNQSAQALVAGYSQESGFTNQWGLGHVKAGRAYANIEVLKGGSATAGAGVTIGFLDSGIDLDHPVLPDRR